MEYTDTYRKLYAETAMVTFYKKNGELRVMLATRNINTSAIQYGYLGGILNSRSSKCNSQNKNIAVIDLVIGDVRVFNIDRVVDIQWLGELTSFEQIEKAVNNMNEYLAKYREAMSGTKVFDGIDTGVTQKPVENEQVVTDVDLDKEFKAEGVKI